MPSYYVTKTYGHEQGLSCCFRQWRADSHCKHLHGYAISVSLTFAATTLDARNWVIDFGSFKPVKQWLHDNFDHVLIVAADDPHWDDLQHLASLGLAKFRCTQAVGCEAFAKEIANHVVDWLSTQTDRVHLTSVTVQEHAGNAAGYMP